jgi:hypothetical protein
MAEISRDASGHMARLMVRLLARPGWYELAAFERDSGLSSRQVRNYVARLKDPEREGGVLAEQGLRVEDEGRGKKRRLRVVRAQDEATTYGPTSQNWAERLFGVHLAAVLVRALAGTTLGEQLEGLVADERGRFTQPELFDTFMGRLRSMLYVHPTGPPGEDVDPALLEHIVGAVIHGRHLELTYDAGSNDSPPFTFVLEPYTLAMVRGTFYLLGVRDGYTDVRSYSVLRIHEATPVKGTRVVRPAGFDPSRLFDGHFGAFAPPDEGDTFEVTLAFTPHPWLVRYLRERRWHATQRFGDQPDAAGRELMTLTVRDLDALIPWVRSFGPDVEVVAPESLRVRVGQWVHADALDD